MLLIYIMKSYKLVNPQIRGTLNTEFKASNSLKAADYAYQSLSKHFSNNIPNFYFTLQKSDDNDYKHFKVTEKKIKNDEEKLECQYEITPIKADSNRLNKFKQKGGDKIIDVFIENDLYTPTYSVLKPTQYEFKVLQQPIYYYYYDPILYKIDNLYIPTFLEPIKPYIYIDLYKL